VRIVSLEVFIYALVGRIKITFFIKKANVQTF